MDKSSVKLFDCFTFFNEREVLKLRLTELWEVVDYFVLVEARRTFSGKPKSLYYAEDPEFFREFREKIIHVVVEDLPVDNNPWVLEAFQRNAILRGLGDARPDDWVLISDVDEIPRPEVLLELRGSSLLAAALQMQLSSFKINFVNTSGEAHSPWTIACRRSHLSAPQIMRQSRMQFLNPEFLNAQAGKVATIPHGGWHLSYLADEEGVREKIAAFSHQELNRPEILAELDIQKLLRTGADVFGRDGYRWQVVPLTDYFPREIVRHPERYSRWIANA